MCKFRTIVFNMNFHYTNNQVIKGITFQYKLHRKHALSLHLIGKSIASKPLKIKYKLGKMKKILTSVFINVLGE